MLHREGADEERMEQVLVQSLREILAHQDAARFLVWAQDAIPRTLGLEHEDLAPGEERRLAALLATAIWNATPLPRQGFRTRPLAEPERNAPCRCGSGLTYGACCGQVDDPPELSADLIWELLIEELGERELRRAVAEGAVPAHLLVVIADRWLDEDRPGRAVSLLGPLFDKDAETLDERFDPALNVLCDAYDRRDHWKKKRDLLERMTRHACRGLRAAAWQRLSTIHLDEGDFEQADAAFTQALRQGPDNPGTALLEITLLAARHKDALARERAGFWRRKLARAGLREDAEIMAFLARAAEDPQDALVTSQAATIDPLLLRLRDWIRAAADRALPDYGLEPCRDADDPGRVAPFPDTDSADPHRPSPPRADPARLRPPQALRRLEARWRGVLATPKPDSTRLTPPVETDLWEREDWLHFLAGHPEAADSLDILDDLATALYLHPESSLPWLARALLVPVLERGRRILERALPPAVAGTLPWSTTENRPALRLLFRLYLFQTEGGFDAPAAATLETLLRRNPGDDHGVRAELMNHYLRQHEDAKALELAERFPGDPLADLAYGEVLALYRLGRHADAQHALAAAVDRLPRISHYLTRKRVRRPAPRPAAGATGDDDRAWLYREAMRDVWAAEPRVLAWLKRLT